MQRFLSGWYAHFPVHGYGVLIAIGFIFSTYLIQQQAERLGEKNPKMYVDLSFRLLLIGLIGGRILFVFTQWRLFLIRPWEVFYVWRGGLVFYGGFACACVAAIAWARKQQVSFFYLADLLIPAVAFNHLWGRLGCLVSGCCFGLPTSSRLGIIYSVGSPAYWAQLGQGLISVAENTRPVHPTPIYEALGEGVLFACLIYFRCLKRYHGQLLLFWMVAYSFLRVGIECLRGDVERGLFLDAAFSTSQILSLVLIFLSGCLLIYFKKTNITSRPLS